MHPLSDVYNHRYKRGLLADTGFNLLQGRNIASICMDGWTGGWILI